jgi:phage terminase small subunit
MPRRSIEDRIGAYLRAKGKHPRPPDILSPSANALWRRIVNDRPPDFFRPAAQELLAQYCELCITQRINLEMVRLDPKHVKWQGAAARMQAVINSTAVKLRLAVSSSVQKKAGILDEREVDIGDGDNVLLFGGGKVVW